jgi:hypothetical protein
LDAPVEIVVPFLHCCAYYLTNFSALIAEGKANPDFHRSLLFHAVELLKAGYDPSTMDFRNKDAHKIGLQAIDFANNVLALPQLF